MKSYYGNIGTDVTVERATSFQNVIRALHVKKNLKLRKEIGMLNERYPSLLINRPESNDGNVMSGKLMVWNFLGLQLTTI